MFKKSRDEGENTSRNWKRQLPLSLLGAALGAFVALNYSSSTFALIVGAVLGALGAYYYA